MDIKELYWAAGFLEGEGYFSCGGSKRSSPTIAASQVNLQPLIRLKEVLGGKIDGPYASQHAKGNAFVRWRVGGVEAVGLMMALYPLMSDKRRVAIKRALETWRTAPGGSNTWSQLGRCPKGHALEGDNRYMAPGATVKRVRCRACMIAHRESLKVVRPEKEGVG